jgi:hypothetical protein
MVLLDDKAKSLGGGSIMSASDPQPILSVTRPHPLEQQGLIRENADRRIVIAFALGLALLLTTGWGVLQSGVIKSAVLSPTLARDSVGTRTDALSDLSSRETPTDDVTTQSENLVLCCDDGSSVPLHSEPAFGSNAIAASVAESIPPNPFLSTPPVIVSTQPDRKTPVAIVPPTSRMNLANKPKMKRRYSVSEEDLRMQLAWAPELGLSGPEWTELIRRYLEAYYPSLHVSGGVFSEHFGPGLLLDMRPDLKQLPVRSGRYLGLDERGIEVLSDLSQQLRLYLKRAVPIDAAGNRLDADVLRWVVSYERRWFRPEAVPVLRQLLMHEDKPLRLLLIELLNSIPGDSATTVIAERAVFDLAPDVREAAVTALRSRPTRSYRDILLRSLRYPWAPAADHAAEALIALEDREAIPKLVQMLEAPDPGRPIQRKDGKLEVREVVRVRHSTNCVMCHPPAATSRDPATGVVPGMTLRLSTSQVRSLGMCETDRLMVNPLRVRGDITFFRQDFSVQQPSLVTNLNSKAFESRFDYLVRTRILSPEKFQRLKKHVPAAGESEQRQALLFALRELTGKNPGVAAQDWKVALLNSKNTP